MENHPIFNGITAVPHYLYFFYVTVDDSEDSIEYSVQVPSNVYNSCGKDDQLRCEIKFITRADGTTEIDSIWIK